MNLYVAGPMRGRPRFNFPKFFRTEGFLLVMGHEVFNPAARDNKAHGTDISAGNDTGDEEQAEREHGFSLRDALAADTKYICETADGVVVLPEWYLSSGARAEVALALALGLRIFYLDEDNNDLIDVTTVAPRIAASAVLA